MGESGHILGLLTQNVDGLVIEGLGGGHLPQGVADVAREAASRIPVVLASRTGGGFILSRSYGFPGGEIDLLSAGLISAGDLDGPKARLLLEVALRTALSQSPQPNLLSIAREAFLT